MVTVGESMDEVGIEGDCMQYFIRQLFSTNVLYAFQILR